MIQALVSLVKMTLILKRF